jgi:salicylate hydroxylase
MLDKRFHVGIVGGGIGGLALAQGLKKAGMSVAVYERDRTPTDRLQGYRVHISPKGSEALHSCLPAALFEVFAVTCGVGNRGFRFLTEKMEELLSIEIRSDPRAIAQHRSASRITLRQVLLSGLDDILHFGKTFTRYEEAADRPIVLHFHRRGRHCGQSDADRREPSALAAARARRHRLGDVARPPRHVHRPARIR